jgi:sialic acid synthase SpsE
MMEFGNRQIGQGEPCLVIAELGTSHQGDLAAARRLIDAAVAAGADCIKFQLVYAAEILHPRSGEVDLPTGRIALYERFASMERDSAFYRALKQHTEAAGALFLCTPFGIRSARELRSLGVRALKIASPELNHLPLLREVSGFGLPLFLSSGVSTLADIERALSITGRAASVLLHCITAYPAPEEEYNLRLLEGLRCLLGVEVGLSDHSLDAILVPVAAVLCGAVMVEKHFTLSREGSGLDDPIALEPGDFGRMVRAIRDAEASGPGRTRKRLERSYGVARVKAVLGSGIKDLAPSERRNYGRTNRSIHAMREIPEGVFIREADVALLRTEKVLRPGIPPEYLSLAIGARARRLIPDGEGVEWADIVERSMGAGLAGNRPIR